MTPWILALPVQAVLFLHPLKLPPGARLWMLFPIVVCVAVVYRATRSVSPRELPLASLRTFLSIVVGMGLISAAAYLIHEAVLRWF